MHTLLKTSTFRSRRGPGLVVALLLSAAAPAFAQDKGTLNLLVKKGVITQADADSVAKSAVVVNPKVVDVKALKIEGMIQLQYDWLTTEDKGAGAANSPAGSEFFVRRAYLGALIDLGNGWGGEIAFDFAAGISPPAAGTSQATGGNGAQNNFERIVITKTVDKYGLATAGFRKVSFTVEEYTTTADLKPNEHSIVSRYFDESYSGSTNGRLGFADRHNGLYWDGKIPELAQLTYGAAVTTGVQSSTGFTAAPGATGSGGLNKFAGWAYVAYADTDGALSYKVGLNLGYSADGNSVTGPGAGAAASQSNAIWGYNPYVVLGYGPVDVTAEFIQTQVGNGRLNAATGLSRASPYGVTITPSYKINSDWEIVARYSYLNTNGRGVTINNVVRNAANVNGAATLFNDGQSFYLGVNWFLVSNSVKLLVGYEFSQFNGRGTAAGDNTYTGAHANVSGFRTRLQLLF